jgi:hypothetical protein
MMSSDAEEEGGGCAAEGVGAGGDPEGTLRRNPVRLRLLGKAGMGRTRVEIEGGLGLGFGEREEMRGRSATGGAWSDIVASGESTSRLGGDGTGASRSTGADGKGALTSTFLSTSAQNIFSIRFDGVDDFIYLLDQLQFHQNKILVKIVLYVIRIMLR